MQLESEPCDVRLHNNTFLTSWTILSKSGMIHHRGKRNKINCKFYDSNLPLLRSQEAGAQVPKCDNLKKKFKKFSQLKRKLNS